MAVVATFHSINLNGSTTHHNNDQCLEGSNIDPKSRRPGTAGRPLCSNCNSLD